MICFPKCFQLLHNPFPIHTQVRQNSSLSYAGHRTLRNSPSDDDRSVFYVAIPPFLYFVSSYSPPTSTTMSHWLRRSWLRVRTITIIKNCINLHTMVPVFGEESEHWNRERLIRMKSTIMCSNGFSAFRNHISINFSRKAVIHSFTNIRREQIYSLYILLNTRPQTLRGFCCIERK